MLVSQTLRALEMSLDAAALRHKVIADNIANVDTPGYKRKSVVFESELKKALEQKNNSFTGYRTDPRHLYIGAGNDLGRIEGKIVTHPGILNNNKNNVDIDYEMAALAKNQLWYNTLVGQLNHHYRMMRTVIEGRSS